MSDFVITNDQQAQVYPWAGGNIPAQFSLLPYAADLRGQAIGACARYAATMMIECDRRASGLLTPTLSTQYLAMKASQKFYGNVQHADIFVSGGSAVGGIYRDIGICTTEFLSDFTHNTAPSAAADADAATRRGLANYSLRRPWITEEAWKLNPSLFEEVIASGHPVEFGFNVWESFTPETLGQNGIVPMPDIEHERYLTGHATYFFRYDRDRQLLGGHDNRAGSQFFWMPYQYVVMYGFASSGAWAVKSAPTTQTFPFPPPAPPVVVTPPPPPQGTAVTYTEIIAAIKTGTWTLVELGGFKLAADAKVPPVVVTPPPAAGMSPEGFRIPRDGLVITQAQGALSIGATADVYGERQIFVNGVPKIMATIAEVIDGKIIIRQRGDNVSKWDWDARTTAYWGGRKPA